MSFAPEDVALAEQRALAARARLKATLGAVQERLRPSQLAQDAVESAAHGVASVALAETLASWAATNESAPAASQR